MKFLLAYVIAVNLIAYYLMFYDKECAKSGQWRVPEKLLFRIAAMGGSIGGTLGMFRFHHKTKHRYFRYGFPIIAVVEGLLFFCLFCFI